MTEAEKAAIRERIAAWKRAAPVLERLRDEEIRAADTHRAMRLFSCSAEWIAASWPAAPTSGLVEQQRWFMKLRRG